MLNPIPGHPDYSASEDGQIFSLKSGKFLSPVRNHKGYLRVQLYENGAPKSHTVHSLVLRAFVGERPAGAIARHLNGNPADNRKANLVWGTREENEQDKRCHGTVTSGSRNSQALLSDEAVIEIRSIRSRDGLRYDRRALAAKFGVCLDTISKAAHAIHWKDASMAPPADNKENDND